MEETEHAPSWNDCPPEILIIVFQYLDAKSLIDCMTINKKWRYIAETVCQKVGWKTIAEQGLYNGGIHLMSTDLGWKRKVMNSCLWSIYASIGYTITKLHEYEVTPLSRRSYVYREILNGESLTRELLKSLTREVGLIKAVWGSTSTSQKITAKKGRCVLRVIEFSKLLRSWYVSNREGIARVILNVLQAFVGCGNHFTSHDNMVIIDRTGVTYYNVRNYEVTKLELMKCYNYEENDYVTMNLTYTGQGSNIEINLHTKSCSDNCKLHPQSSRCATIIPTWQTFHLSQEVCYVLLSNGELQAHRWDGHDWVKTTQARYYGMPDYMFALYKYREHLYGLSQSKGLWRLNSALMQVKKICSLNLPQNMPTQLQLALFYFLCSVVYEYGVMATEALGDFYKKLSYNITCAKFYGGIIFLGDSDGKVMACKPTYLAHTNIFDVRVHEVCNVIHFLNTKQDPTVMDLNVFEDHNSHNLFIHTHTSTWQVKIDPSCTVFDDDDS